MHPRRHPASGGRQTPHRAGVHVLRRVERRHRRICGRRRPRSAESCSPPESSSRRWTECCRITARCVEIGAHSSQRYDLVFLHRFAADLGKPIALDGREHIEYVATQVVTEYLRFVSSNAVDGILYRSAQNDGVCCVLFYDAGLSSQQWAWGRQGQIGRLCADERHLPLTYDIRATNHRISPDEEVL
ncbi:RES domain-containing protein [Amycolatopsis sp. CA-128772]|uniref:RES domain-containing protein n=1 Tax=Amycolatopsis sp. CA-128772 TaxID=2073159 RepID=UPI0011B01602